MTRLVCADLAPLLDEPVAISVVDAVPGATVRVEASQRAGTVELRSWATFEVPADGVLDVATATPLDGTYQDADTRGLWWSMQLLGDPADVELGPAPTTVTLRDADGTELDHVTVERRAALPGIEPLPVRDHGLLATYFRPLGDGPFPAVVVVSGSEGGDQSTMLLAALLASRGIAALSVAYFAAPGLPDHLCEIPLEYFDPAFDWLLARPEVRGPRVAVAGGSRGGELALLLGATSDRVGAVVGHVPSGVVWPALQGWRSKASWTRNGVGFPYVSWDRAPRGRLLMLRAFLRKPVVLRPIFQWYLDHTPRRVAAAEIPVEDIDGPVLLVSGEDDRMWPSTQLAEIAVDRARAHGKEDVTHLRYPGAGHLISIPGSPSPDSSDHPVLNATFAFGGTPATNNAASADSWPKVLAFLHEHG